MAPKPLAWINKRIPSTILMLALTLVFAWIALGEHSADRRLQQHGLPADAAVTGATSGRYGSTTVRFSDADGEVVEVRLRNRFGDGEVGERLPIVYDPQDPAVNSPAASAHETSFLVYGGAFMAVFCLTLAALTWTRVVDWERWAKRRGR
ncbi:MAG TPA: hypothetical protein PJ992_03080 [Arachnia sp.]|nr:hypothetical protein [Arachnia sp.]